MRRSDPFWISDRELEFARAYCRRYFELKSLYMATDGRKGVAYDGDGIHSGISDPTMVVGERRANLAKKIEVIEHAARYASPNLWTYILLYIADPKTTYEKLKERGFPLNKNHLTKLVRKAYYFVSQEA